MWRQTGPIIISMTYMIIDVLVFLFIFVIVYISFTLCVVYIYEVSIVSIAWGLQPKLGK